MESFNPNDIVYLSSDNPEMLSRLIREAGSQGPFTVEYVEKSPGSRAKHPQVLGLMSLKGSYSGHFLTKKPYGQQ
jgi:hypothetical protein